MHDTLRRAAAAVLLAAVLGIAWSALYDTDRSSQLIVLAVVAALPVLGDLSPRSPRAAAAAGTVLAALVVGAMAAQVSVWSLAGLSGEAWGAVARLIPDGMAASSSASVPASPVDDAAFVGLLDAAFAALVAGVAWQLVSRRRPVAAVILAGLGLAYRWTVTAPDRPLLAGTLALAALIAVLALGGRTPAPPRRGWGVRVAGAGLAAVLGAALLAPGAATQDRGWWDWRSWSLTGDASGGTGLDIRQTYGQLDWPEKPRVVMRVQSPRRLPLRAAVLSDFDGSAFTQALDGVVSRPLEVDNGRVFVQANPDITRESVRQDVTFASLRSTLVLAGGIPLVVTGRFGGIAQLREGGTVQVDPSLGPGTSYTAFVAVEDASPRDLVDRDTYSPQEALDTQGMTAIRPSAGAESVLVPLFGTGGADPTDDALGAYAVVRREARRVIGDAASPYVAVNRIETYLRQGFSYDEAPPFPVDGTPPLVDFLTNTRRGFCQHFAGAMALMLRSVGIPARIAVGYTPGRFDPQLRKYVVLDRDAHSWVQAYLPDAGWVDFDPTPGRAVANRASVSSPRYDPPPAADPARPDVTQQPVDPVTDGQQAPTPRRRSSGPPRRPRRPSPPAGAATASTRTAAGGGALVLLLLPGAYRALRRARLRHTGDERARVLGAVGDLESALRRTGIAPPEDGDARERAAWLRRNAGLDAARLYALAEAARYAPGRPARGTAREAWRESARLRREGRSRAGWPRRLAAYLGVRPPDRSTLTA
ncbi:MAG: transglutaminase-like domain-containing protein [Thermoleophilia bacterium]